MNYRQAIMDYEPYNEQERTDKARMLEYIDTFQDILTRNNDAAHFTASAWVVNEDFTKTVMAYHNIYDSWSWVGGHVDGDDNFLRVALKEVEEETGLQNITPVSENIYAIEILDVPAHVKKGKKIRTHLHLNVTYLLQASETDTLAIKPDENSAVAWMELDEAVARTTEPEMKPIYQKLNDKLPKNGQS
ncbi:NUDIX hydrolase [Jeotgalibaca sp. A122]|uniref:NUDIX hydrolase n=1 Tax=Jeotgalibaca sp. A122 TaxID=3457322 RepID=UPI003FD2A56E